MPRTLSALLLWLIVSSLLPGVQAAPQESKKKKNKKDEDPVTQVLPLPKDLPNAITAETARLTYINSPLSAKGLLTAQTREAMKYLIGATSRGQTIVKLRALVAGSGDTRRIATLVSEMMTEKKLPLPALSTVQVGSLGMVGAQVLIQAIVMDRRAVNPNGVAFVSGQVGENFREAAGRMAGALEAAHAGEVLSMTCFVSSLEDTSADRTGVMATAILVQMRREASPTKFECEAVARLRAAPAQAVVLLSPPQLTQSLPRYSQVALVNTQKVAFTGLQLCFHDQEADAKLAFERLGRTIEAVPAKFADVVFTHTYALSTKAMDLVRSVRFNFLPKDPPPASTMLPFEGLPALDAAFGMEVVLAIR